MKKISLISLLSLCFSFSNVHAKPSAETILSRLSNMVDKVGRAETNTKMGHTEECRVVVESDETGTSVSIDAAFYFTPIAHLFNGEVKVEDNDTILVSTSSKRAGGDACGDWGGAVGYKKRLIITEDKVTVRESFRCTLEGLKKYVLESSCQF